MSVISRQFAKDILLSTIFVLIVLIALFAFFDLIGQLDDLGADYTIGRAFLTTSLTLPSRAYEVMPLAVLLASVYTMSKWASTSEFTVLRASGCSPWRLARSLLIPGVICVLATYGLGEIVAPAAQRFAQEVRSGTNASLSIRGFASGAWVRDVINSPEDGRVERYINVRNLSASDRQLTGAWRMFEFNRDDGRLLRLVRAESGRWTGTGWELTNAVIIHYPAVTATKDAPQQGSVTTEHVDALKLTSTVNPDILSVMTTKPDRMSMDELNRFIEHLDQVHQDTEHYVSVFWSKAFYPFICLVMLAVAMPFAYMNARSGGMAVQIFCGVLVGIAFYALNNIFLYLSVLSSMPPALMAALPSILMCFAAALSLWWLERR